MLIGISGKSGSGKTTLSNNLKELLPREVVHLDIDKVGHNVLLLDKVKEELIKAFGSNIVNNENIDRKKLGEIVFNNREEMQKLTDITWNFMQKDIDSFIESNKDKIIILDWLLLPITKYFKMCDLTILLDIPYEIRKKRAMARDNIIEEEFDLRESSSIDLNPKDFDYVLKNNNKNEIRKLVKKI